MTNNNYTKAQIKDAIEQLWTAGVLEWKLDAAQKKMYEFWNKVPGKISVINCSRRIGKSYFLTVIAIQQCLTKPKSKVKFLQPEQKMIRMNVKPIMDKILEDCPAHIRPRFKTQDNVYEFPNGSEIQLAGTDNGNEEKLRGGDADLCLIDEAAFVKGDLKYIINSILIPTTTITRGKIILCSTSPKEPDHAFQKYLEKAEVSNTLIKINIYDALEFNKAEPKPRITEEIIQEIINEYPNGDADDEFRREYMCITISDGDNMIIPEFNEDTMTEIIKEWPKPAFCDRYVSMDIGFKDLTAVLFGFYDFDNAILVVEDEIIVSGPSMTTDKLAEDIINKEHQLWTNDLTGEFTPPFIRVSDNNLIVINDLARLHGLYFVPTQKDNKEMQVNNLRVMINSMRLTIHPRCKTLIHHLKHGTWNKKRNGFTRSPDAGHYDAIDALVYMLRSIDQNKNPYPPGFRRSQLIGGNRDDFFVNNYNDQSDTSLKGLLEGMFKTKSSLGRGRR